MEETCFFVFFQLQINHKTNAFAFSSDELIAIFGLANVQLTTLSIKQYS